MRRYFQYCEEKEVIDYAANGVQVSHVKSFHVDRVNIESRGRDAGIEIRPQ